MRATIAAVGLLLGCNVAGNEIPLTRHQALLPEGQVVYHLTQSNVAELRSVDVEVTQWLQDGNLVLSLCLRHNSLYNAALGIDHFYYDAAVPPFSLLSVNEAGWCLNYDGMVADGFGIFGSHKNANPAGHGGISCEAPLVFTLAGDPTGDQNTPLELALHIRYEGDCSGWISNRLNSGTPYADVNCRRLPDCPPPPPICYPQPQ
jgi:hypothetical protein